MGKDKPVIFISCGQFTEAERETGKHITEIVDASGTFRGYFAENQSSFQGVTRNIFAQIYNCFGLICVMHDRGTVSSLDREPTTRASVWVEQEIAIAAFLAEVLNRDVKTRVYIKKGIHREGVRDKVIINPKEFEAEDEIIADLPAILREWAQLYSLETESFRDLLEGLLVEFCYDKEILALDLNNFQPVFYERLMDLIKSGEVENMDSGMKGSLKKAYLDLMNYASALRRIEKIENYASQANEIGRVLSPCKAAARKSVNVAIELMKQHLAKTLEGVSVDEA